MGAMKYRRIGDLLRDTGLVTFEQLKDALALQQLTHERLGEVLVRKGHVTEAQVVEVLDFQLGIPHVSLAATHIDRSSVTRIPETISKQYLCLALRVHGHKLIVAMADPLNRGVLHHIRSITGYDIEPVIAAKSELQWYIELLYGRINPSETSVCEPVVLSHPGFPSLFDLTKFIYKMLEDAVLQRVSSIHIDSWTHQVAIQYRIDMALHLYQVLPTSYAEMLFARIRELAGINEDDQGVSEGTIHFLNGRMESVFTVLIIPTLQGEKCTLRDVSVNRGATDGEESWDHQLMPLQDILQLDRGLILVSVPATQTATDLLHQLLTMSRRPDRQLISFEAWPNQLLPGVHQIELNRLRSVVEMRRLLQFDANVIALPNSTDIQTGDLRHLAQRSLVLLVTSAPPTSYGSLQFLYRLGLQTIFDEGIVKGVIARCQVRTLCDKCVTNAIRSSDNVEERIKALDEGAYPQPVGCEQCGFTGYSGRISCYEVVPLDDGMQAVLKQGLDITEAQWESLLVARGITPVKQQVINLTIAGRTSFSEIRDIIQP